MEAKGSVSALHTLSQVMSPDRIASAEPNTFTAPALPDLSSLPSPLPDPLPLPAANPPRTKLRNFGAIGTVVGHEITHGFDVKGAHYNEAGDLENWWTDSVAISSLYLLPLSPPPGQSIFLLTYRSCESAP